MFSEYNSLLAPVKGHVSSYGSIDVNHYGDDVPYREPFDALKARVDIVDIVGRYTDLKGRGGELWGCCPIHREKTASFKVNEARQSFYCFGCHAKGDVFDFVKEIEGVDMATAIKRVRELAGGGEIDPAADAARAARRAQADAKAALDAAWNRDRALRVLAGSEPLTRRSDPLAVAYLIERRGITQWQPDTLRWHPYCPWELGYAPCIVVPVENVAGEVTGIWRIRPVMEGEVERKGLGPVKGCCARAIDHAAQPVIVITEGVEDALAAWQLTTYPAWAALSCGNMTVLELPNQFEQVIICADAEPQGREAAFTLTNRLMAEGRQVDVIEPEAGKDANDVLRSRRVA